jgi:hypothetical protein
MRVRLCSILAIVSLPAFAQDTALPASTPGQVPETASATPALVQEDDGYGMSKAQAIEVCYPQGQREYLARLVCPGGAHPTFERSGSVGPRTPLPDDMSDAQIETLLADMRSPDKAGGEGLDLHVVDAYEVVCGEQRTRLYLDMYHCAADRPTRAPKGFTILD